MDAAVNARFIRDAGTSETEWLAAPALHRMKVVDADALVPPGRRLVVVAPHPDDEVLAAGGLLASIAHRGESALVVAVTDGEAGGPTHRAAQTALKRAAESREALQELGLGAHAIERLNMADGQVKLHLVSLTRALESILQDQDVVVTTWRYDGHPDHEACAHAVADAAHARGASVLEAPVWGWHWATPQHPAFPWMRALRMNLDEALMERKRLAMARFASQINPGDGSEPVLAPSTLARFYRDFEVYFR